MLYHEKKRKEVWLRENFVFNQPDLGCSFPLEIPEIPTKKWHLDLIHGLLD